MWFGLSPAWCLESGNWRELRQESEHWHEAPHILVTTSPLSEQPECKSLIPRYLLPMSPLIVIGERRAFLVTEVTGTCDDNGDSLRPFNNIKNWDLYGNFECLQKPMNLLPDRFRRDEGF